ncbi:hypothetical protein JRC04_04815 [Mycolicibacterium sp. S2-37]|uniref:MAP7 domain-containing protein n=1 Tax=Mycolicibacterium sp. S2-37 TaxID=2810297 RepID=UPI001A942AC9|nr:hypothetical protein [Mycolicibacterium sp. S2-37]MBO0676781.1 hypothetical protein [Mycolicibacterium sp. S2-37]
MPRVTLDLFTRLHGRSAKQSRDELVNNFKQAGTMSADQFAKAFDKANPKIRRAANHMADAFQEANKQARAQRRATQDQIKADQQAAVFYAAAAEQRRKAREAYTRAAVLESQAGSDQAGVQKDLNKLRKEAENLTRAAAKAESEYERSVRRSESAEESATRSAEARERALRSQTDAQYEFNQALKEQEHLERKRRGGGASGVVGSMLTDLPFVPGGRAGAFIGGGVLMGMASIAEAAVTASQSIALLPAVAMAGGAAFGTLAMGVHGFADALKDMGDPKKWAEGLATLAPNAQQAALEIKALVDGPLGDLKRRVQDGLFKGVPERIHNLTDQFLPGASRLTEGISGSMNNMFMNMTGFLMQPKQAESIDRIINNIVKAFQNLEPAIVPFTDAILRLPEAGSGFLPELATSLANAANDFANFITKAQQSGDLGEFMRKGIDAAKTLIDMLIILGRKVYEIFGNKSPEQFKASLDTVIGTVSAIAKAIAGAANALGWFINGIDPVIQAVGGWEDAIQGVFLAMATWKGLSLFTDITNKFAGLGGSANLAADAIGAAGERGGKGFASKLKSTLLAVGWASLGAQIGDMLMDPILRKIDSLNGTKLAEIGLPGSGQFAWNLVTDPLGTLDGANPFKNKPAKRGGWAPGAPGGSVGTPIPGTIGADTGSITPGPTPYQSGKAGLGPYQDKPVPGIPEDGPKPSDKDIRDQIWATLDPNAFMPDLSGILGSSPSMVSPTLGPGSLAGAGNVSGIGEGKTTPGIDQLAAIIAQQFPGVNLGGWRPSDGPNTPTGHQRGVALDIGIQDMAVGDQINQFLRDNAAALGVKSTIWRDVWADMAGNTSHSGGHQDHVHVEVGGQPIGAPPLEYGTGGKPYAKPGYGYTDIDQRAIVEAERAVIKEATDVRDARMEAAVRERDGISTQRDIAEAKQKIIEEEWQLDDAMQRLLEAQQGTWRKVTNGSKSLKDAFGELGAGLDDDLGLSEGLPGLADNLIRFVASLAMAPVMGPMAMMAANSGGGHGMIGMWAAQNGISSGGSGPASATSFSTPYGPGGVPTSASSMSNPFSQNFGTPGTPQATANMIYQMAIQRGYSPHEAQSIVAYAIGESSLDPLADGGPQGGAGEEHRVLGLFQMKPAFAIGGGINPSMRTNPQANTFAYLNQLDKTLAQNPGMSIEDALSATSKGGPLGKGPGAQPQAWSPLYAQAGEYVGGAGVPPTGGGSSSALGAGMGLPSLLGTPTGMPTAAYAGTGPLPGPHGGPAAPAGGPGGLGNYAQAAPFTSPSAGLGSGPAPGPSMGPGTGMTGAPGTGGGGLAGNSWMDLAGSVAAPALDAMAPGAGQAAQTGMKLANRTIGYLGQLGAIGVSGLMETFTLAGSSSLADPTKTLPGRVLAGIAGGKPAIPNTAGVTGGQPDQGKKSEAAEKAQGKDGAPLFHVDHMHVGSSQDGRQVVQDASRQTDQYAYLGNFQR